ncbi:subtilisin protease [Hordeum vulgare]|nr:subtilisin protease [Hordeum vulgare]
MTTAYNLDNSGEIIKDLATGTQLMPFVRGAGHVDPNSALNPGLVSPSSPGTAPSLTARRSPARSGDLNYPAFTAVFSSYKDSVTYHRVLSNVGSDANAVYEAKVESPAGVVAKMTPAKLVFDEEHRSLAYEITLAVSGNPVIVDDEKNK